MPREDSPIRVDTLFGGMTRPSLLWGLPPAAVGVILVIPLFMMICFRSMLCLALVPILYGVVYSITAKDPRQFRYIALSFKTRRRGMNRGIWKASSYATTRYRKR